MWTNGRVTMHRSKSSHPDWTSSDEKCCNWWNNGKVSILTVLLKPMPSSHKSRQFDWQSNMSQKWCFHWVLCNQCINLHSWIANLCDLTIRMNLWSALRKCCTNICKSIGTIDTSVWSHHAEIMEIQDRKSCKCWIFSNLSFVSTRLLQGNEMKCATNKGRVSILDQSSPIITRLTRVITRDITQSSAPFQVSQVDCWLP